MAPYRVSGDEHHAEAPADAGIVGEVIAQFADSFAFLRELVQNAIDAGTPSVDVQITWDGALNRLTVAVRDRGTGMTRDVLENQLLVLFRSTKEKDASKIGKFGIGFASVLAPNPVLVVVDTVAAEAPPGQRRRLSLQLSRDLTYRLFDAGPATQAGTVVQLELAMTASEAEEFAARSVAALERWCRHASIPIHVEVQVGEGGASKVRIDRPLALDDAIVEIREVLDDGKLVVVLGVVGSGDTSVGFFNHGLTLHETMIPLVGPYACKIQDARLGHTLSRDNVRRDGAFDHAVARATALGPKLHVAIARALRDTADRADLHDYQRLVTAIRRSELALSSHEWWVPLVEPVRRPGDDAPRRAVQLAGSEGWQAAQSSAVTRTLAHHGVPVRLATAGPVSEIGADANAELVVVTRHAADTANEHALLGALAAQFESAGRTPRVVELAAIEGVLGGALAVAAEPDDAVHVIRERGAPYALMRARAARSPFARLRRAPLLLNTRHPTVRAACDASDPRVAASQLARLVLLQYELLDEDRSERILAHTLAQLGEGGT